MQIWQDGITTTVRKRWYKVAGKIIADTIEASGSQISLNVGNVTILTASSTGLTLTPTNNVNINVTNSNVTFTTANITGVATFSAGSNTAPSITRAGDTNTGLYFPAADTIGFVEGGVEAMRIDSSGNLGIGTTSLAFTSGTGLEVERAGVATLRVDNSTSTAAGEFRADATGTAIDCRGLEIFRVLTGGSERMRIASDGAFLIGKTATDDTTEGFAYRASKYLSLVRNGGAPLSINRLTNDGELVELIQDSTKEGTISVSGTTVSYNGGHLSRWAQTTTAKDDTLVKGTVLSNLDEMNVYTDADGNPVNNEQLNKVKVSDVEGDANVAGVFVNWSHDEDHNVDEINMAMTGDMIIRIAQGVTVARGDLLMSAGDGTAKPQGDDIIRSKTVAKVTSNHVTCTYADGSYCVPCVLMAC